MKRFLASKYFLVISSVLILVFNAVLFLSVATWKEELFKIASFWGLYACVMLMFIASLLLGVFTNKDIKKQNLFSTLVFPVSILGIILGIILFFFGLIGEFNSTAETVDFDTCKECLLHPSNCK